MNGTLGVSKCAIANAESETVEGGSSATEPVGLSIEV